MRGAGRPLAVVVALTAVAAAYVGMRVPRFERAERALALRVRRPRGPVVDGAVAAGTDLGSMFAVGGLAGVLAATGRRRAALDAVASAAAAWGAAQGAKLLVGRLRPYQSEGAFLLIAEPAGTSWPSGHPAVAAAVTTVLWPRLGPRGRGTAAGLTGFVAASRVYVGVHYPTDVVAGVGLGVLCGALWQSLRRWVSDRRSSSASGSGPDPRRSGDRQALADHRRRASGQPLGDVAEGAGRGQVGI